MSRRDPSKTTALRNRYQSELRRRISEIRQEIIFVVVDVDAFGLNNDLPVLNAVSPDTWRFETDATKIALYRDWLQEKFSNKLLHPVGSLDPWYATYLESSYKKGMLHAYIDAKKGDAVATPQFSAGSRQAFLESAFAAPEAAAKLELIYTRNFSALKNFTSQMEQDTSRILTDAILRGESPRTVARTLGKEVNRLTKSRAMTIARTEMIHAHAEGQLDAFEMLNIEEVEAKAEWITAGDDRVCSLCAPLEGMIMPIKEARGAIPRHPNCRCAWTVAADLASKQQAKIKQEKKQAIKASVAAEGGQDESQWIA